jgi:CubicO group peptidase (beta-lactamase class C family)
LKRLKTKATTTILLIIITVLSNTLGLSQNIEGSNHDGEIDSHVNQYLKRSEIPGLNIAVTSSEKFLYQGSFGVQQIGSTKPMSTNIASPIGSLTKSFTALAILQQVEKGTLSLEDKVTRYIPLYKTFDKEKSDTITIEMLLNNSSGLPHTVDFSTFFRNNPSMDFEKAIRKHEKIRLYFDPGTSYSYSNEGFMIAGYILELVTGMSYVDYIKAYIFEPLEMDHSTTSIEELLETEFIHGHLAGVDGFLPANKIYSGIMIPAGSELISTTSDLSHYAQMLMNGGTYDDRQLLGRELFEKYLSDGKNPFKRYHLELSYQSGWMHIKDSSLMMHLGQTFSASSILIIDKERKVAVSILCNVDDVVNGEDSIYNLALYLLQLFTNKDYSQHLQLTLPILKEDTDFIQRDKKIIGQYQTSSGLVKAIIAETESGSLEAVFQSDLGVSSYELSFVTSREVYAKNVGSEIILNVTRSTSNDIIGFTHPSIGSFERINVQTLTGYHKIQNDFMSSVIPDEFAFSNNNLSKGLIELRVEASTLMTDELPSYMEEIFARLRLENKYNRLIETSTLREFTLNGLSCCEKIQIIEYQDNIYALVFYNIQDIKKRSSITIYGSIPFECLTKIRSDVIQMFIKNLYTSGGI